VRFAPPNTVSKLSAALLSFRRTEASATGSAEREDSASAARACQGKRDRKRISRSPADSEMTYEDHILTISQLNYRHCKEEHYISQRSRFGVDLHMKMWAKHNLLIGAKEIRLGGQFSRCQCFIHEKSPFSEYSAFCEDIIYAATFAVAVLLLTAKRREADAIVAHLLGVLLGSG
ncbi:Protein of unknown function, partial [Gryllus bimaculatus]